jgi:transcriptional regulator with XRE-family HTH domain
MPNRIDDLLVRLKKEKGMTVPEFAKRCGLSASTVYSARNKDDMRHIHIDVFLKIAHGLGMSAEELYYGYVDGEHGNEYSDDRQRDANDIWEHVSEEYRAQMVSHVQTIEKAYRYEIEHTAKDGSE